MPADASIGAIASGENWGLRREPAKRRTSASTSMPTSPSMPANTSHSRVEWPMVQRVPITRSEEHTSELQSLMPTSYAVFCLTKQKNAQTHTRHTLHTQVL